MYSTKVINKSIIVLVILALGGTLGGYYYGNNQGYIKGYDTGHSIGYSTGYESGYKTGFANGTEVGYDEGYPIGYEAGDTAGYSRGYAAGNLAGYSLGYSNGNSTGYSIGWANGYSATGFNIRDPTYSEVISFITLDRTNENTYIEGSYICHDYSYDVKRNAFNFGYRCFFVAIEMGDLMIQHGHALVAFNTTDRGILYIEPQDDRIMNVQVGQPYWDRSIYKAPDYDDTITKIELIP